MPAFRAIGSDRDKIRGAQIDAASIKRVLQYAVAYKKMLASFVLVLLISSVISILPALLVRQIIDVAIPAADRSAVTKLALAMALVSVVSSALGLTERWFSATIGEKLTFDLRCQLFDHIQRMPMSFFTNAQTGSIISRLNSDVVGAQSALSDTFGNIISNAIVFTTTFVAMFMLEWRLPLLALCLLPFYLLPTRRVGQSLRRLSRRRMASDSTMNARLTERFNVSGALLVKLFGSHDRELQEFADSASKVRDLGIRTSLYRRVFMSGMALVGMLAVAIVYWVGGHMAITNIESGKGITVGTVVAISMYVTRIYLPLTALSNARVDLMTAMVSFERVFEVLDSPNPITESKNAHLLVANGEISGRNVSFSYPKTPPGPQSLFEEALQQKATTQPMGEDTGKDASKSDSKPVELSLDNTQITNSGPATAAVLKDINFEIAPGELVALVGPSGAGKSTLISLLIRLYDVDSGSIEIDGINIRDISMQSLRDSIGVVSQDSHMFHDTVAANLLYANPAATMSELKKACEEAQILDVIQRLPDGFDTIVGERGYRLSGGEKQRLSIARMLLKNPSIVILDEATSHLDSENEALVQAALAQALHGRTAIVIAHRLSTITAANQILVLDDGQIVESGNHIELLETGGLYSELYRTLIRN